MSTNTSVKSFAFLIIGVLLFFLGIPYLNILGAILILIGLFFPLIGMDTYIKDSNDPYILSKQQKIDEEIAALETSPKVVDTSVLLGGYMIRASQGDKLAIPWLIEFSKNPDPEIRLLTCTKLHQLRKYDKRIISRLYEMEQGDPDPKIRETAKAILQV